jgi:hypothetical protein
MPQLKSDVLTWISSTVKAASRMIKEINYCYHMQQLKSDSSTCIISTVTADLNAAPCTTYNLIFLPASAAAVTAARS